MLRAAHEDRHPRSRRDRQHLRLPARARWPRCHRHRPRCSPRLSRARVGDRQEHRRARRGPRPGRPRSHDRVGPRAGHRARVSGRRRAARAGRQRRADDPVHVQHRTGPNSALWCRIPGCCLSLPSRCQALHRAPCHCLVWFATRLIPRVGEPVAWAVGLEPIDRLGGELGLVQAHVEFHRRAKIFGSRERLECGGFYPLVRQVSEHAGADLTLLRLRRRSRAAALTRRQQSSQVELMTYHGCHSLFSQPRAYSSTF